MAVGGSQPANPGGADGGGGDMIARIEAVLKKEEEKQAKARETLDPLKGNIAVAKSGQS